MLLWLRRPESLLNAQFWAEDGGVFFQQQLLHGFWRSLAQPYSGYIHVIPRLIAAVMSFLPVRSTPLGYNASALLIEAVSCSAFFWPCYRKIIASDKLRATCCLAMTASTVVGSELIATVSNLQWYLCVLSVLLMVAGGHQSTEKAAEVWLSIAQVFIALTAPTTLLFIPFLLWQVKNKPGCLKVRPVLHLAALFLQVWIMRQDNAAPKAAFHFDSLFLATLSSGLSRCILAPMIGTRFLTYNSEVALFTKLVLALSLGVAFATLLAVRLQGSPRLRWLLCAAYIGIGSLLAVLWGRGVVKEFLSLDGLRNYTAERYFFIGTCMFIFCVALAIDTFTQTMKYGIAAVLLAGAFALGTVRNFPAKTFVDLHWIDSAAKIEKWEIASRRHERVESISVPINPPNFVLILDDND